MVDLVEVAWNGRLRGRGDRLTIQAAVPERRERGATYHSDGLPDRCEPFDVLMT